MQPLIFDASDAMLRVTDNGATVAAAPGFALAENGAVVATGDAALGQARRRPRLVSNDYWYRLSGEPMEAFPGLSRADFASAQVAAMLPGDEFAGREVVVLVPSDMARTALGLLLGVMQANQLSVAGLVDASVAATRSRYADRVALHLSLGLHAGTIARMYQTTEATAIEDVRTIEGSGLLALRDAWAKYFAGEFVRQCRYDPLHSADSEQGLYDRLDDWLTSVEARGDASLSLEGGGRSHQIAVSRVDVINVVAEHYQRLADTARALLSAGESAALQMALSVSGLPGLADMIVARVGGDYHTVADDAAVEGARERLAGVSVDAGRVLRELPTEATVAPQSTQAVRDEGLPTHLLLGARAIALDDAPLTIGAGSPQAPQRYLLLEGSPPGVSGLHCDIGLANGQCLLTDHSRYGTFLNGSRINGSATLRVGDTVRVGTPGLELQLIRTESI